MTDLKEKRIRANGKIEKKYEKIVSSLTQRIDEFDKRLERTG